MMNKFLMLLKRLLIFVLENCLNTIPVLIIATELALLGIFGLVDGMGIGIMLIILNPIMLIKGVTFDLGSILFALYFISVLCLLRAYTTLVINYLFNFKKTSFTWATIIGVFCVCLVANYFKYHNNIKEILSSALLYTVLIVTPVIGLLQPIISRKMNCQQIKNTMGLRVIIDDLSPLSFPRSLFRETIKYISLYILPVVCIIPLIRKDGRAFHDILANTRVVNVKK